MLKGKVAIVTGGAKGIGRGIADKLNSEGAKVVIFDLEKIEKYYSVVCDVSNFDKVQESVKQVVRKFKKIDILVNNAGIYPSKNLKEMSEEDWDKMINIDLKSVFNCTKAVLPYMKNGGKIVNVTSIAGTCVGFKGLTHYCAAKAGIAGFTKSAALELASQKINVNAIAPGLILTPGVKDNIKNKEIENMSKIIPWQRAGKPDDIANTVKFLVSEDADYITGQTIVVDGGWTIQ